MGRTFGFLLLLALTSAIVSSKSAKSALTPDDCQDGEFLNTEIGECDACAECGEFMYIRTECTKEANTQCGWCGRFMVIENEDFKKKCEGSLFGLGRLRKYIAQQVENQWTNDVPELPELPEDEMPDESEESEEDDRLLDEDVGQVHIVQLRKRPQEEEYDDSEDYPMDAASYVDWMSREKQEAFVDEEYLEEVKPQQVDEHDIGEEARVETSDDSVQEISLESRKDPFEVPEILLADEIPALEKQTEAEKIPLSFFIGGALSSNEDSPSSSKSEEEEAIEGRRIVIVDVLTDEEQKSESYDARLLSRFCGLFIISIAVYILAYRRLQMRHRKRVILLPDITCLTEEQRIMIERCAGKVVKSSKEDHCYENQMAYV